MYVLFFYNARIKTRISPTSRLMTQNDKTSVVLKTRQDYSVVKPNRVLRNCLRYEDASPVSPGAVVDLGPLTRPGQRAHNWHGVP